MKIIALSFIYKITSILCDPGNEFNSTSFSKNAESPTTENSLTTATHATFPRASLSKPAITFSPIIDNWNFTKILTKKGVDLRNHLDNSIRISSPSNGDFQSLIRESSFWVDKSLLVKELWQKLGNLNVVLIAPPKWGKSINLSMLKFYLALPLDLNGFEIPRGQSASYRYFHEGKVVQLDGTVDELDGTPLISGYEEHLANHPVIHINGNKLNIDDALESFRTTIHETYQAHKSLLNRLTMKQQKANSSEEKNAISNDIKDFCSFYELSRINQLNEDQLVRSICNLTRLLFKTYQRKVVVLIDDYDHFVQKAYFNSSSTPTPPHQQKEIESIWACFLSFTFTKMNSLLEKALLTGVLRSHDEETLKTYENFYNADVFGYVDLFPYYGIFQPEYRQMIDKRGINASLADNATQWYGGYRTLSHPYVQMYATYPVTRFLTTLQIRPDYDTSSSYLTNFVERLFRRPQFQRRLRAFIDTFEHDRHHLAAILPPCLGALTRREYRTIWEIEHDQIEYSAKTEDEMYSVMISIGYAAIHEDRSDYEMIVIRIPNRNIYYRYCAALSTNHE